MISANVLGVSVVGEPILTETEIQATIVNGPVKPEVVKQEKRPIKVVYDLERARWYAIAMLRQLGRTEASAERPKTRQKSYSQTHVKPLNEERKGKKKDIGVDDLVQEGALIFTTIQKRGLTPQSTRACVRRAYFNYLRQAGVKWRKPSKNAYALRIAHGSIKRVMDTFDEAVVMPDTDSVLHLPAQLRENQRTICEYLSQGYDVRTIAKYTGLSRRHVDRLITGLRSEFKREEFYPPTNTIPQHETERPFNNHYRPYARQLHLQDCVDVPSHRDTRQELPVVPMANAMYGSTAFQPIPLPIIEGEFVYPATVLQTISERTYDVIAGQMMQINGKRYAACGPTKWTILCIG